MPPGLTEYHSDEAPSEPPVLTVSVTRQGRGRRDDQQLLSISDATVL